MKKACCITLMVLALAAGLQPAGLAQDQLSVTGPANAAKLEFKALTVDKLELSVWDAAQNPLPGLGKEDFIIRSGATRARILSVEPLAADSPTLSPGYIVSFRFFKPPTGVVEIDPPELTIEEVTTIDSAPLLNYIYFESGKSDIPPRYALLEDPAQAREFTEENLNGALQKHRQVLNIIGKRLKMNPQATIRLTGCNSDSAEEKGKIALSRSRAESIRSYLQSIWGIDLSRIQVESRNLPVMPSAPRTPEGRAENQRVEIDSDFADILDTVETTYVEKIPSSRSLRILPRIEAEAGVADWKIKLAGETLEIGQAEGRGGLPPEVAFNLEQIGWNSLATQKNLTASVQVTDQEGNLLQDPGAVSIPVQFIESEEQALEKQGFSVVEKYALILFDFDSAVIKDRNQVIVAKIAGRLREFPNAVVKIAGYTDDMGQPDYNLKLSERRARAVGDQIMRSGIGSGYLMTSEGAGSHHPLYDNAMPEGRALNRTVIVTLEYERPI